MTIIRHGMLDRVDLLITALIMDTLPTDFYEMKIFDLNIPLFFALRAPNVIILHSK